MGLLHTVLGVELGVPAGVDVVKHVKRNLDVGDGGPKASFFYYIFNKCYDSVTSLPFKGNMTD